MENELYSNLEKMLTEDNDEDSCICTYYFASRTQRDAEIVRGEGLEGTSGYELTGCY